MTMRLHDLLDYWAERQPDATYVFDGARSVTWGEMRAWSSRIGAWLSTEVEQGGRFVLLDRNSVEMLAVYWGASRAGVVPVPLNYRLAPKEWEYQVLDSGSEFAVVGAEYAPELAAAAGTALTQGVVIDGAHGAWGDFGDAVARHRDTDESRVRDVAPEDPFYQVYTSGTTGKPKGAVVSHRAISTNALQAIVSYESVRQSSLTVMPIFHAGGAMSAFAATAAGDTTRLVRDFQPDEMLGILSTERIERATFAPAMIQMMVDLPRSRELSFPDLRLMQYGSSAVSPTLLREAMAVFGCGFQQAYGMSELGAVSTVLSPADHRRALEGDEELLTSAGRAVLGTQVRVVGHPDARALPAGEVGEIVVRGPQMMTEYWGRPEATTEALRDGWMHTGDAGRIDERGYLFICDRIKDMIISGGENIYPREIEDVLTLHPEVGEAAVVAIPDQRWGEAPLAVIVRVAGARVTEDDLIGHCRSHLARYKTPRSFTFVEALPRNTTGKVLKRDLRDPYWQGRSRAVG